jgi:hypothetical protein
MSNIWLGKAILAGAVFLVFGVTSGCTNVVVPLKSGTAALEDSDHGLIFGRTHLTKHRKDQRRQGVDLKWLITEESTGKQILIDKLPIDGPYVVKLPIGSYRLTAVNLDIVVGVWQASLPATFVVHPRACTYLGTWELDTQVERFSGSITRRVTDQQQRDEEELGRMIGRGACPILKTLVESPMDSSLTLIDRAEGTELTSPE